MDLVVQANFLLKISRYPYILTKALFSSIGIRIKKKFSSSPKKSLDLGNFSKKIFLLKKFFYVFFPMCYSEEKFFFIKPSYVLSKLKKNFAAILFLANLIKLGGGNRKDSEKNSKNNSVDHICPYVLTFFSKKFPSLLGLQKSSLFGLCGPG